MSINISCLVSIGRHPVSGSPCRAQTDARAVELALQIQATNKDVSLDVIHAGSEHIDALQGYLGMGVDKIQLLNIDSDKDVCPALSTYLAEKNHSILLTGMSSEAGESSGMLPYVLADDLGWTVVSHVVSVERKGDKLSVLQALPRGQRHAVDVSLPVVLMVDIAAESPRQSAYGVARKGEILNVDVSDADLLFAFKPEWEVSVARQRAKRLKVVKATSAKERFKAATAVQGGGGKVLEGIDAKEGARSIIEYLKEHGAL